VRYCGVLDHGFRLETLVKYNYAFMPSKFESLSIFALDCVYLNIKLICINRNLPFFDLYEQCGNAVHFSDLTKYAAVTDVVLRRQLLIYFERLNNFNRILLTK
jgi:hypothetical protein